MYTSFRAVIKDLYLSFYAHYLVSDHNSMVDSEANAFVINHPFPVAIPGLLFRVLWLDFAFLCVNIHTVHHLSLYKGLQVWIVHLMWPQGV